VKTKEWEAPEEPERICGPAERLLVDSSSRSLLYLVMDDDFAVDNGKNCFGLLLDNAREMKTTLDNSTVGVLMFMFLFAVLVFVVYGLFTQFAVLRKIDIIAETAYNTLVGNEYDSYYNKSARPSKEKHRDSSQNEFIHMATLAAQTVEKNMAEYDKKKECLLLEKIHSSVVADQLRLLALYCGRTEDDFEAILLTKRKKDKHKKRRLNDRSFFSVDVGQVLSETITLEHIVNDPFAVEMLKNFSVKDPLTNRTKYPARRSVLFLLSAMFYRSMSHGVCTQARLDCIKDIIDELFSTILFPEVQPTEFLMMMLLAFLK